MPSAPKRHQNEEIVLKISHSNIDNRQTFYTDANGLFMQKRILDYFYNSETEKRIEPNYYPVNSAIYVEDWFESPSEQEAGLRMTVLNDRTQGGSSLRKGEIEIMLDRKTAFDDGQGVFEPLRDTMDHYGKEHKAGLEVVTTHKIIVDSKSSKQNLQRRIQFYDDLSPIVMIGKYSGSKFGQVAQTATPVADGDVYKKMPNFVGGWGGYCECPSGKTYAVGDQRNSCGSLSCINGKAGECFKKEGDWSGNSVVCSTEIPEMNTAFTEFGKNTLQEFNMELMSNKFGNELIKVSESMNDATDYIVRVTNLSEDQKGFKFFNEELKSYLFEGLFVGMDSEVLEQEKKLWVLEQTSMNYYENLKQVEDRKIGWNKYNTYQNTAQQGPDGGSQLVKSCEDGECELKKEYAMKRFDILTFAFYKKD